MQARNWMIRLGVILIALAGIGDAAIAQTSSPVTVKIIAFNDFHGNLASPGNFIGKPSGGADVLAGYISKLKSQNPLNITVHAGDMTGASPLVSAFFYDEGAIETMNRAGVDYASVGNHEFDFGKTELLRKQQGGCAPSDATGKLTCQGATVGTPVPFEGAKYKYLAANVTVDATGATLFPPYAVKTLTTASGQRLRLAFIGMTLKATPTIVTPTGVAGLTFNDEASTVNALVPRLKALGVQAIVVVVHQGGFNTGDISTCPGDPGNTDTLDAAGLAGSDIATIVNQLSDSVDLVVSAHTHNAYVCQIPNAAGRKIPVTSASAFGRVLTNIDLTIDPAAGKVTNIAASNMIVDRTPATLAAQNITPNSTIANIVNGYTNLAAPLSSQVIGQILTDVPNTRGSTGDNPAGNLIADAQLAATAGLTGAQIAMMNPGGVRVSGFLLSQTNPPITSGPGPGNVTYGQAFTVQPFGNSLITMKLTGQDLKDVLEQQFNGCSVRGLPAQNGGTKILLVSAGFTYTWDATRTLCDRVTSIALNGTAIYNGGAVLNPTFTYLVTVNNFLSTGGDNFTVFKSGQNFIGGAQDIDALVNYFSNFKSPNGAYNPAVVPNRIVRTDSGTTIP